MKTKTIRKRFDNLEQAREYAASVNKTLKRNAAVVSEIYKTDFNQGRNVRGYDEWLNAITVFAYYEVCFTTKSSKF